MLGSKWSCPPLATNFLFYRNVFSIKEFILLENENIRYFCFAYYVIFLWHDHK